MIFFATTHGKSLSDGAGGFVKHYVAKLSSQRCLHDQILSYQSMLDLCAREIPSMTFFSVSQEEMVMEDCLQSQRPCLEQGVATILDQYLATKLLTNSQVMIESFFNLISINH